MNLELEKALQFIDLQQTEKAVECLKKAIQQEEDAGNECSAIECRCILGELYFLNHCPDEANEELAKVVEYSMKTGELLKQREIAETYLMVMSGKLAAPTPAQRPGDVPLVFKPVQDKNFISKQMNKRHR